MGVLLLLSCCTSGTVVADISINVVLVHASLAPVVHRYAAMASLVCQWLSMLQRATNEDAPEDAPGTPQSHHHSLDVRHARASSMIACVAKLQTPFVSGTTTLVLIEKWYTTRCAGHEHDTHGQEYHFLSQVVKQNFRSECFQDILLNGGPPPWVSELISDSGGRDLIFQLAAAHTNPDPFLAWTIKNIIAAGHEPPVPLDRSSFGQPIAHKCAPVTRCPA